MSVSGEQSAKSKCAILYPSTERRDLLSTYFIADPHFGHKNIIKHSKRPFADVDEMNTTMVRLWNERVTNKDDVYIIGDIYHGKTYEAIELIGRLNGQKYLIIGNHDRKLLRDSKFRRLFVEIAEMKTITLKDRTKIVLCHYPLAEWDGYFRGYWHIYGHIHNSKNMAWELMSKQKCALNAGAEIVNYIPASFDELVHYNQSHRKGIDN